MKRILLLSAVLLLALKVSAQGDFRGGITFGLNSARIDNDTHELFGRLGLNGGVYAQRDILPGLLYWQLELKYTARGKYNATNFPNSISIIKLGYFEAPISLHGMINDRMSVGLGIAPDVLVSEGYFDENGPIASPVSGELDQFGITGLVEFTYRINERFSAGVRFNYSIIPFYRFAGTAVRFWDSGYFHDVLSINLSTAIVR